MRRWAIVGVAAAITAGAGLAVWTVGPPIANAAMTRVTTADESVPIVRGEASASITVPRGWAVHPVIGDAGRITLTSPDGVMTVDLVVADDADAEAAARLLAPWSQAQVREPEGIGRTLVHARSERPRTIVGWLSAPHASAVAFRASPSPRYDAELALLLGTIELAP